MHDERGVFGTCKGLAGFSGLHWLLDTSFDPNDPDNISVDLVRAAVAPVRAVGKWYFRAEVHGVELLPEGPTLIVGNHNSGITFMDPFFMAAEYYVRRRTDSPLYFLAHDAIVAMPVLGKTLCRLGAVRASRENALKVFQRRGKVVVYPGGNREAFRSFKDRHRIDLAGRTGFIELALEAGVPISPVVHIGGHETFFVLTPGYGLAEALGLKKLLKSETCAVFLGLPWGIFIGPMFHFPLPAKMVTKFCEPVYLDELGYRPGDAKDPDRLKEIYREVHSRMQSAMDELAAERRRIVLG